MVQDLRERDCYTCKRDLKDAYLKLLFNKKKSNIKNLIKIDNVTAIANIIRMGGGKIKLLNQPVKQIWDWCQIHQIFFLAELHQVLKYKT